jgi:DNA invertase Pin-like site-specific DNA recombinase
LGGFQERPDVDARLAEKVKALREEGGTQAQIAAELRIAQSTVSIILRRDGLGGRLIGRKDASAISLVRPREPESVLRPTLRDQKQLRAH